MEKKTKIMLVASPGGHFVQLSLVSECLQDMDITVVGTYEDKPSFMYGDRYFKLSDFSRDNPYIAVKELFECLSIFKKTRPSLIVTTGAAPGLIMLLVGRLFGTKTIWLESIANSRKLSLSGKIAKGLGITVFSQWENVAKLSNVEYHGRVL